MRHGIYPAKTPHGPILAQKLYNPGHEGDDFLSVVLVQREHDFVIWTHNQSAGGFAGGQYIKDADDAWKAFNERGRK